MSEKEAALSKFVPATPLLYQTAPKMIIMASIIIFSMPRRLFSRIPHSHDDPCKRQENVLTAIAMPAIIAAVGVVPVAWNIAAAKATELLAVFPNTKKEMPNRQVARYRGVLRK